MYAVRASDSAERAQELASTVASLPPAQREETIPRAMQTAIRGLGAPVGRFTYRSKTGSRRTHPGHAFKICAPDIAPVERHLARTRPRRIRADDLPLLFELS